jgi:antirestriction protein ArdC
MSDQKETKPVDVYQVITNRIIELLEQGTVPWRKPWTDKGLPMNAITKRPYRGINMMLLNSLDYPHNLFMTWKQIKTIGGSVKRGETGLFVVFTKMIDKEVDRNGKKEIERKSILRYYKVFNIDQCTDIPVPFLPKENTEVVPLLECASIIGCMKDAPKIVHKKSGAFYMPPEDYINMPRMKTFATSEDYYGTLFHELIHSTGHQSRLSRKEIYENPKFGTDMYSLEELVAEIGSCYLKSYAGLPIADMANNASYIQSWLDVFASDTKILIKAASRAQQAVEYILNPKVEEPVAHSEELILEMEVEAV